MTDLLQIRGVSPDNDILMHVISKCSQLEDMLTNHQFFIFEVYAKPHVRQSVIVNYLSHRLFANEAEYQV